MNTLRAISIALLAASSVACSSTPNKPAVPAIADLSGSWNVTVESPGNVFEGKMVVVQSGGDIQGTIEGYFQGAFASVGYTGAVNGNDVKFSYGLEKFGAPAGTRFDYSGSLDGSGMRGKALFATFGEGTWMAKRP